MCKHLIISLFCVVLLSACGGSSDDAPQVPNFPPMLVNAGTDLSVNEGQSVTLNGVASGGDGNYTFLWTVPEGVVIEQPNQTSPEATLIAPVVTQDTSFTLTLQASDSEGRSAMRSIALMVSPVNIAPVASISANTLETYTALSYPVGAQVVLDAGASFDQDPQTNAADIASYQWQQVAGENVLQGAVTNASTLRFTTPITLDSNTVDIMLTVTDQEGAQSTERITLNLLGERGTLPLISVGKPITVFSGEQMPLSAEVSSIAPNAPPFLVEWKHGFAGALTIANVNQSNTVAQAPLVEQTTQITFEISVLDAFDNEVSNSVTYIVHPPQRAPFNDSGVSLSASENGFEAAYVVDFPAQDAQFGSDRMAASGLLDKAGRGENGFDFTRLNNNGDPEDDVTRPWRCVRDNVTGLVWEVKTTEASSLHYANQLFTWYQEGNNGDFAGDLNLTSTSCNIASQECNTEAFVEAVNEVGLCGFFDWRMPNHAELQSIVHYGKSTGTLLDRDYFPFASTVAQSPLWYWTDQSSADGVNNDQARNAWAIDFATGVDNFLSKSNEQRVRLVRAGRVTR